MTSNEFAELITNLYDIEVTRLKHTTTFVTLVYGSIASSTLWILLKKYTLSQLQLQCRCLCRRKCLRNSRQNSMFQCCVYLSIRPCLKVQRSVMMGLFLLLVYQNVCEMNYIFKLQKQLWCRTVCANWKPLYFIALVVCEQTCIFSTGICCMRDH